MKTNKTSITVSIDLEDEYERKLFEYVMSKGSRKKSGYIKRLIHADMVGISEASLARHLVDDQDDEDEEGIDTSSFI